MKHIQPLALILLAIGIFNAMMWRWTSLGYGPFPHDGWGFTSVIATFLAGVFSLISAISEIRRG